MSSFLFFRFLILDEFRELRFGILAQFLGVAVLNAAACVKDHNIITVDDRVDSMRDGEHCSLCEGLLHELLDLLFGDNVDVGSSLIQHYNLVASQDSSANANKLFLSSTQTRRVI